MSWYVFLNPYIVVALYLLVTAVHGILRISMSEPVSAEIVDVVRTRRRRKLGSRRRGTKTTVFVRYVYRGEVYDNVALSLLLVKYKIGRCVTIYIDPKSPLKVRQLSMYLVMLILGLVFSVQYALYAYRIIN